MSSRLSCDNLLGAGVRLAAIEAELLDKGSYITKVGPSRVGEMSEMSDRVTCKTGVVAITGQSGDSGGPSVLLVRPGSPAKSGRVRRLSGVNLTVLRLRL